MKQSLSLKLGQQLKMTPQLQQAIRLLQLSAVELEQEVQDNLDANPLLENEDDFAAHGGNDSQQDSEHLNDGLDAPPGDLAGDTYSDLSTDQLDQDKNYLDDFGDVGLEAPSNDYREEMISTDTVDAAIDGPESLKSAINSRHP